MFEVTPVVLSETGRAFEFPVADYLTEEIKSMLKKKGYLIAEGPGAVESTVVIKTSLKLYDVAVGSRSGIGIEIQSSFVDKKTGKTIGKMLKVVEIVRRRPLPIDWKSDLVFLAVQIGGEIKHADCDTMQYPVLMGC